MRKNRRFIMMVWLVWLVIMLLVVPANAWAFSDKAKKGASLLVGAAIGAVIDKDHRARGAAIGAVASHLLTTTLLGAAKAQAVAPSWLVGRRVVVLIDRYGDVGSYRRELQEGLTEALFEAGIDVVRPRRLYWSYRDDPDRYQNIQYIFLITVGRVTDVTSSSVFRNGERRGKSKGKRVLMKVQVLDAVTQSIVAYGTGDESYTKMSFFKVGSYEQSSSLTLIRAAIRAGKEALRNMKFR
jgi:hypothetical protein